MMIRPVRVTDADALSALAQASKAYWRYSGQQLAAWAPDLLVTGAQLAACPGLVAEIDGRPVGFFLLGHEPEGWDLAHFWVHPRAMGRGLGRALLGRAVALVAERGGRCLRVDADPNAEPFYLACGATRTGAVAAPIEGMAQRVRPQLVLSVR